MNIEIRQLGAGDEERLVELFDVVVPGFSGSLLDPD
jgi:hypothetical protein